MKDLKIIIADDNKGISEQYKNYIEKNSNFKITDIAVSSKQEMEMIEKYSPDVIITDYIRNNEDISGIDIILDCEKNNINTIFACLSIKFLYRSNIHITSYCHNYIKIPL